MMDVEDRICMSLIREINESIPALESQENRKMVRYIHQTVFNFFKKWGNQARKEWIGRREWNERLNGTSKGGQSACEIWGIWA